MTRIAEEPPDAALPAEPAPTPRSHLRLVVKLFVVGAVSVIAYFAVRSRLPSLTDIATTVRTADPRWVAFAVLAEAVSIGMFAAQQRRLLLAFGVRMSAARAVAVTFSRSAIAVALPAGSAVSAGFAFQQYRQRGATRPVATTVTILSALASTAGLVLLYLGGLGTVSVAWLAPLWSAHFVAILLGASGVLAVALGGWAWRRRTGSATVRPVAPDDADLDGVPADSAATTGGWALRLRRALIPVGAAVREARAVAARHWIITLAFAVANWMLDLVCLIAVAHACHLDLGYPHLAAAYLAVQVVRQLPITPGGIGLIETSLLAALVSAGAGHAPAAAVVLGYRLLSCWLVIPVGLLTWLGLRLPGSILARTPDSAHRPQTSATRDRRPPAGARELRRGYGRRSSRLRNSGPGGVRRPRQRQPH